MCTAIGITAFDGASEGQTWANAEALLQKLFSQIAGIATSTSLQLTQIFGLLATIAMVGGFYTLGVSGMRSIERKYEPAILRKLFAHSLVPLSLGYVIAHYFSLVTFQGQATGRLVSDPLGNGTDYFGTASAVVNYNVISATHIWYIQVGALIAGHVAGLVLAHDKALVIFNDAREALRSQYWMLVVMVGFTSLGLWLLSQANV